MLVTNINHFSVLKYDISQKLEAECSLWTYLSSTWRALVVGFSSDVLLVEVVAHP